MLHGRELFASKKRGEAIGPTRKGKGTKWVVVADGRGVPIGHLTASASPSEYRLAEATLNTVRIPRNGPGRPRKRLPKIIADRGYDSDPLRAAFKRRGTRLLVPNRPNRRNNLQDKRTIRCYKRRWIIERTNSWISSWKRIAVRYDRLLSTWNGLLHAAFMVITVRKL
jgi:transposase